MRGHLRPLPGICHCCSIRVSPTSSLMPMWPCSRCCHSIVLFLVHPVSFGVHLKSLLSLGPWSKDHWETRPTEGQHGGPHWLFHISPVSHHSPSKKRAVQSQEWHIRRLRMDYTAREHHWPTPSEAGHEQEHSVIPG